MKKFIMIGIGVFIVIILVTLALLKTRTPNPLSQQTHPLSQETVQQKKMSGVLDEKFAAYYKARRHQLLFTCTQKLSEYQGIPLSADFPSVLTQSTTDTDHARSELYHTLNSAKASINDTDVTRRINQFFEVDNANTSAAKDITRGDCWNYAVDFGDQVLTTLNHYSPVSRAPLATTKPHTIYLNAKYQLENITFNVDQHALPDTLLINNNEYPIHCSYKDVQQYDEALSLNTPINDAAYTASHYFYNQLSPQMDSIFTCTSETPLPETDKIAVSDTYPWYQPVVVGGDHEHAAGDSLIYINNNQLVVVLGHEPCMCNSSTEEACHQTKNESRDFKTHSWHLIDAFDKEKPRHNSQAQAAITVFINYTKNELKKDFCFINRDGVIKQLSILTDQLKVAEPEGIQH